MSWEILDPVLDYWADARQARPVRVRHLGAGLGVRDDAAGPAGNGGGRDRRSAGRPPPTRSTRSSIGLREEGGAVTMGRVLTLVIAPDSEAMLEESDRGGQLRQPRASLPGDRGAGGRPRRRRATAGCRRSGSAATQAPARSWCCGCPGPLADHASSVVMPFLLPDTPVVAWWPACAPAVPAQDPLGQLAIRRITDATNGSDPLACDQEQAGRATPRVTPIWRGAASPTGGRCWPRRSTRRRTSRSTRRWFPA